MKRILIISYWLLALILIAIVVMSLGYTFPESLFIATFFLPGAFLTLYLPSKLLQDRKRAFKGVVYVTLAIIIAEVFLVMSAHFIILGMRGALSQVDKWENMPEILMNPVFIVIVESAFVAGNYFLWKRLRTRYPDNGRQLSFVSERHNVTVAVCDILYVESNDTETTVVLSDGTRYRNRTPISRWADLLGDSFIRVHRSYLVNTSAVDSMSSDSISVCGICLPVSRNYRDSVREFYHRKLSNG